MTIEIAKAFSSYFTERELPETASGRSFEFILPYQVEGSGKTREFRWTWPYSDAHAAEDQRRGIDGLDKRRNRAVGLFREHLEKELAQNGQRLYSETGQSMLILGKIR
jgi:hypothetical protein